jgi:hypothetical protein
MTEPTVVYRPFALPSIESMISAILGNTEAAAIYDYDDLRTSTRLDLQQIARNHGVVVGGTGGGDSDSFGLAIRVDAIEATINTGRLSQGALDTAYGGSGGGGSAGYIDGGAASSEGSTDFIDGGPA